MARTLLDMAKSMEKRAATLAEVGNQAKVRKALAALRYLVDITPVDTSRALSNWQIGVGTPPQQPRQAFFHGSHGSTRGPSSEAAYAWGSEVLKESKAGWPIYISNLAPYIRALNDGSSRQHPGGFVEQAVAVMRTTA